MPIPIAIGVGVLIKVAVIAAITSALVLFVLDIEEWVWLGINRILDTLEVDLDSSAWLRNDARWFADIVKLWTGLTLVLGAYTVRFLIRRLPFLG